MIDNTQIDPETILRLAKAAHLPLGPDRAAQLAPQLRAWLMAANELNAKMSDPENMNVAPATVFTHATLEGVGE